MERFADWVRTDCSVNQHYFSFYEIPELIVKKKVSKKDYLCINKMLMKAKRSYLAYKIKLMPDKNIEQVNVTDEDMVPLELLQQTISMIKHKQDERRATWL
jgi:hypothetical protein